MRSCIHNNIRSTTWQKTWHGIPSYDSCPSADEGSQQWTQNPYPARAEGAPIRADAQSPRFAWANAQSPCFACTENAQSRSDAPCPCAAYTSAAAHKPQTVWLPLSARTPHRRTPHRDSPADCANRQLLLDGGSVHQRSVLHPLLLSRRHEAVRRRNDLLLRLSGHTWQEHGCVYIIRFYLNHIRLRLIQGMRMRYNSSYERT